VNWKKIVLWVAVVVVVVVVGVVTAAVLLLKYNHSFRQSLLARVEQSVYNSTGAQLRVRDFNVNLSSLSVDLYGVVVHGTEPPDHPPLLTADHVNADVNVDSLFQRKWHFQDIVVEHPEARLVVNKAGENNLPKPKQSTGKSKTNLFDLGIRRFVLDRGAVYYNDRKTPLEADLHDLELTAGYDPAQKRYMGHMSYDNGRLQYGDYAPLPHNLDAAFNLTPDTFNLDRLALELGHSHAVLNASIQNYSGQPKLQANYDASLATADFARMMKNPSIPSGVIRLTGLVHYQQQPDRPFLETASVWGMLTSPDLYVRTSSVQTSVRNLSAKYKLENGNADVENLRAEVLDGRLDGRLTIRDLTDAGQGQLQASLKDVSLDLLQKVTKTNSLREAHLTGNISAEAQASWATSLKNLMAHSDVTIQASLGENPSTPLNGVIHADYSARGQQLALHQSYIRTPQTAINLDGKIGQLSQLQVRMHSNDLHELESLAANFKTASANENTQQFDLHGAATLNANITGSLNNPRIKGQLTANNLRVKNSAWKLLRTNFTASPQQVALSNGELQSATRGRFAFDLQSSLKHWKYTPANPIVVNLSGANISLADLEHLANKDYPIAGTLALNISIRGTQQNPMGRGTITLTNAKVSDEPVHNINVNFNGNGTALNANVAVRMPAGTAHADATYYPRTQTYQAQVRANDFQLAKLQSVKARNVPVNGALNLSVSGRGNIKNPELLATIEIPTLQVQKQTIRGIKLQTHVQNHVADLALDSTVAETYVKARGSVGTQAPYMANVHLDTGRITFAPILAIYAPAHVNDITGRTELHAWLKGPLQQKERLEAHLQIPQLAVNYKQIQLAAARPIRLDYQSDVAVLEPTAIQGTDTNIQLQAKVPVRNIKAASFLVKGGIDLRIAELIQPTLQSTGQIQFDIDSSRYTAGSNLNGQVRIVNATMHTPTSPVGLDHANGVISITKDRVEISSFQATVGGGTITARGGVAYRPAIQFDLGMAAKQVRIRYPQGLRTVLNSNLSMTGSSQAALVSGQVLIEHISFTPDFDLTTFVGQFGNEGSSAAPSGGFAQRVKLDIAVQSTSQMQLQSSQVSLSGNANLRIAGTAAMPVVLGRATLNSGEMFLAGNRYTLQNGTIDFLNPVRTEPVVNIRAQTKIDQYNIALNVEGPIERLHTEYTSDPTLPPVDIINLIATGKTTEAAAANPSPGITSGAESLLAQQVSNQVTSRVAKVAGISHLSIDPALGGSGENPGARIAIQQRVTGNLYVTFATDVTSTQRQAIETQYQFNRTWSMNGVRDQNGGFGVDLHYKKDY
jgi:translocation and assembly module TamB